jgi:hypothetical protein
LPTRRSAICCKYGRPTDLKAASLRESTEGRFQGGGVPGFDPPYFRVRFHAAIGAAITGNELPYASVKTTEATAPEAAEASTTAPCRRMIQALIDGETLNEEALKAGKLPLEVLLDRMRQLDGRNDDRPSCDWPRTCVLRERLPAVRGLLAACNDLRVYLPWDTVGNRRAGSAGTIAGTAEPDELGGSRSFVRPFETEYQLSGLSNRSFWFLNFDLPASCRHCATGRPNPIYWPDIKSLIADHARTCDRGGTGRGGLIENITQGGHASVVATR